MVNYTQFADPIYSMSYFISFLHHLLSLSLRFFSLGFQIADFIMLSVHFNYELLFL